MNDLNALIQNVKNATSSVSLITAVRQLSQLRDEATIPMLIEILGYNNPGAAVAAVDGLVLLGDVAVPIILENLDGYDYGARAWANRALAQIGHPLALDNLIEAASSDFALSVRRAAAKGLGFIQWEKMPVEGQKTAQEKVLETLFTVSEDPEWVVRYAAIAGLEGLTQKQPAFIEKVCHHLQQQHPQEKELAVQARMLWALQNLNG